MTDPFAAQPHPFGLPAVPGAQAVFDAELDEESREVSIPSDSKLKGSKRADLAELAGRLNLDTSGSRDDLAERISAERKRREASKPSE